MLLSLVVGQKPHRKEGQVQDLNPEKKTEHHGAQPPDGDLKSNQPPLDKAVNDLEKAEDQLRHAEADEQRAETEVADAIEEIEEARESVKVHVVHVNEAEKATFEEYLDKKLNQVWDKSYSELKIERKPKDVFQTGGAHPKSLMNDLALTLRQAHHQHVIQDYHFGIASETGGA